MRRGKARFIKMITTGIENSLVTFLYYMTKNLDKNDNQKEL
jgi:hypothetical protein